MSGRNLTALAALVRWREFTETRASDVFRRSNQVADKARIASVDAQDKVDAIQQVRLRVLQEHNIDLARLHLVAQVEDVAQDVARERERELDVAQEARQEAQNAYVEARAQTRVADSRNERLSWQRREHEEKLMFDRMADLYTQSRSAQSRSRR